MCRDSGVHSISDISDDSNSECQLVDVKQCHTNAKKEEINNSDDCVIVDVTLSTAIKKADSKDVDSSSDDCQIVDVKSPSKLNKMSKKDVRKSVV